MFRYMKLVALLYFIVAVICMVMLWLKWSPEGEMQTVLWWVVEVVLGYFALANFVSLIFTSGIEKEFKDNSW